MASGSTDLDKSVVLVSADASLRRQLHASLSGLRWDVREARGGAEAMEMLDRRSSGALLLDHWLPDLEVVELAEQISRMYPAMEVLRINGDTLEGDAKGPRRHELLHALREIQRSSSRADAPAPDATDWRSDVAAARWRTSTQSDAAQPFQMQPATTRKPRAREAGSRPMEEAEAAGEELGRRRIQRRESPASAEPGFAPAINGLVGSSAAMQELARTIRLVAPRSATVLIEGETGTGKEVVARSVHGLSTRASKPFVVLNCAAIPEALLEAELFGHARGAFTGAVQSRTGRIEAAHGGTLLLDEIGEMPLGLQAKMLRFLENGELQRVGENEMVNVDVRVIASTHRPLERLAEEGSFRLDLYHRLAVFPIDIPPLRDRMEDIPELSEHFLALLGRRSPRKTLSAAALDKLYLHDWPGNVRELAHVLERASILAENLPVIGAEEIRLRRARKS
ncbi:MAG: sigma-54 dependent transcriptional regulator [Acidobacteriaceae bacterium]